MQFRRIPHPAVLGVLSLAVQLVAAQLHHRRLALSTNMMMTRVCRTAANAAAVPPCRFHRRLLSAIAATSAKAPRPSATTWCAGSMPPTARLVSSGHSASRAYISSTTITLHPDDNDILYLPMPKLSPSMVRVFVFCAMLGWCFRPLSYAVRFVSHLLASTAV